MSQDFRGSYTVAITPFTSDGSSICTDSLKAFLDWQLECRVPGIIILGTTGEFLAISDDERRLVVETTVDHVDGRMQVLVGTMNAYTPLAVRYSKEAEDQGADGVMVIPPYYYTPTDGEIYDYFRAVAQSVRIPVMLYNNPITSNVDMSAELVVRLTEAFDNVRYIKEASMDAGRVYDIVDGTGGVMNVFAGERPLESFLLGAVGYVNPYGNYLPYSTTRMWDYMFEGRLDDAAAIQRILHRFDVAIAEGHPTYGHQCYSKALAAEAGYPMGDVRPPLTTFEALGGEGRERLETLVGLMREMDDLMDRIESQDSAA